MKRVSRSIAVLTCGVAMLGLGVAAIAQTAAQIVDPKVAPFEDKLITSDQMAAVLATAMKDGKPAGISARMMNAATYGTSLIRLVAPDMPHAHGDQSEIFIVREGSGTLMTGGVLACPCSADSGIHKGIFAQPSAGQMAGAGSAKEGDPHNGSAASITGGITQHVKAGDIVLVPQGTPHVWVAVDSPIVYLDIKFK